jgi:hypothetical protein
MSNSLMKPHFSFKYERHSLLILFIPNLFIMLFPCVFCKQSVRPKQHALECESCFQWQHRLCNTGMFVFYSIFKSLKCETLIEIGRYRKIHRKDKIDDECHFFFYCIINRELRNTLFDHFETENKFDIRTEERGSKVQRGTCHLGSCSDLYTVLLFMPVCLILF